MYRILLALVLSVMLTRTASAQMITGTIAAFDASAMAIKTETGDVMRVEVRSLARPGFPPAPGAAAGASPILVTGKEDPKNLKPGLALQFEVVLAGRKTVVGEVEEATLITPGPETRTGVLNAEPADDAPAAADDKKKPVGMLEKCLVVGSITRVRNGSVTVNVPGLKSPITFRFTDDAIVTVSGTNLSVVRIGDKVTAVGSVIGPGRFLAHDVRIEHSPLVDEKVARAKLKAEVGKPGEKDKEERENPFALDPDEKKEDPAAPKKPRVKLELIKIN
jgi:hypothetical protein